jgi:hypothetical protein
MKFVCPYCNATFSFNQSLSRHKKYRCSKNVDSELDICKEKKPKEDINALKIKCDLYEKQNAYLQSLVDKAGTIASDAITSVKSTTSALNYIVQTFSNAPALEPLKNYSEIKNYAVIKNYCGDNDLARVLISLYSDGKLVNYLGDLLISIYKKDDPKEQSVWNSDCARLSYIIRIIIGSKESWIMDKKGIKLKEFIINPLLEYVEKEIWMFLEEPKNANIDNFSRIGNAAKLLKDIRNFVTCKELIKYLAPYFQINRIKEIEN